MRLPPETRRATPLITKDIASVAIKGLIFKNATIIPLTRPTPSPTRSATPMAITGEWCSASSPETTAVRM